MDRNRLDKYRACIQACADAVATAKDAIGLDAEEGPLGHVVAALRAHAENGTRLIALADSQAA